MTRNRPNRPSPGYTDAEWRILRHEEKLASGRLRFWGSALFLIMGLLVSGASHLSMGDEPAVRPVIRLAVMVVLLLFLYRGYRWAKWLVGLIMAVSGFAAAYKSAHYASLIDLAYWSTKSLFYLTFMFWLFNGPVRLFLDNQRLIRKRRSFKDGL